MAYILRGGSSAGLAEAEYVTGISGIVTFSNINSCVGIITLGKDRKLNAVHLVKNKDGVPFGNHQAKTIMLLFPKEWVAVAFVGSYFVWKDGQDASQHWDEKRGAFVTFGPNPPIGAFGELYDYFTNGMDYPALNGNPNDGIHNAMANPNGTDHILIDGQ